jgi:hypothetical protein
MRQKSQVSQRTKQIFSSLNRTPDSEPDNEFFPAPAPHHGNAADTQPYKEENCTKQNVWDSIAKHFNNLICHGNASRNLLNLRPLSPSVPSITVKA